MEVIIKVLLVCIICMSTSSFLKDEVIQFVEASHDVNLQYDSIKADHSVNQIHRTAFHFQPQQHWINDPNGPMYYKGLYHLFYQYNPKGSIWGNIVWAHSVSRDMINWEALEPAIWPSKEFDVEGTWSGSATILPGGKPVLFYTGLDPQSNQVQNVAFPANLSDPYLREWVKPDYNPLIVPSLEMNGSYFRDPTTAWWSGGHWKVVIGGRRGHRGMAHLYRSKDFKHWVKAKHPLHSKAFTGMWECPDFFPVSVSTRGGLDTSIMGENIKHVLKVSLDETRYEYYTVGVYDTKRDRYFPDNTSVDGWNGLRYDYGNFYASKTFFDDKTSRRILWGWANESDSQVDDISKGWAGIQLIPRAVWLDKNGKQLIQWPIEEINSLRGNRVVVAQEKLNHGDILEIKGITAAQADLEAVFSLPESLDNAEPFDPSWVNAQDLCAAKGSTVKGGIGPFGILTLASEGLEEYTPVMFRIFKHHQDDDDKHVVLMCSDASRSTLLPNRCNEKRLCMHKPSYAGFVEVEDLKVSRKLSLRSLIDHSVVESFGDGGKTCITSRVYPSKALFGNARLYAFNNGTDPIVIDKLEAWSMQKPLLMNQQLNPEAA